MHLTSSLLTSARHGLATVATIAVAACAGDRAPATTLALEPVAPPTAPSAAPPAQFDHPAMARYHMHLHFDDLRSLERMLLAGDLARGTTLAHLLVRQADTPITRAWDQDLRAVSAAAFALTRATTIGDALRREARVGAACASCHAHALSLPVFGTLGDVPRDLPTAEARMARHAWATDRLWEGLVGADDVRWSRGLEVIAQTEAPVAALVGSPPMQLRLQQLARETLAAPPTSLDARAAIYGDLLVLCADCHAHRP